MELDEKERAIMKEELQFKNDGDYEVIEKPVFIDILPLRKTRNKNKKKRCVKKCLKIISVGPLDNGLYFRKKQRYLSVCSGIFTLLGVIGLLTISLFVFLDILYKKNQNPDLSYESFNVFDRNVLLSEFLDKTALSFKVHAYSYWDEIPEPLSCEQFEASLHYLDPGAKTIK